MVFAACDPNNKPDNPGGDPEEPEYSAPIVVDGSIDDWARLDQSKVAIAKNSRDGAWDGVNEMRVYADEYFVFYYIEYNNAVVSDLLASAGETLPMRINLNTDGEFSSGYANYFLQSYDFIIEIQLAEEGKWINSGGTLHQRVGSDWNELAGPSSGLVSCAGNGNKVEIVLVREIFDNAVAASESASPLGDVFQTSLRFYETSSTGKWEELSNIPNGNITEDNPDGYGKLLEVTTVK